MTAEDISQARECLDEAIERYEKEKYWRTGQTGSVQIPISAALAAREALSVDLAALKQDISTAIMSTAPPNSKSIGGAWKRRSYADSFSGPVD